MWCDHQPNSEYACQDLSQDHLQYTQYQNYHHDFPHYSHHHENCFQHSHPVEMNNCNMYLDQQVAADYGQQPTEQFYNCRNYCNNGWPAVVPDSEPVPCPLAPSHCCRPDSNSSNEEMTIKSKREVLTNFLNERASPNQDDCTMCVNVKNDTGDEQSIAIGDLVDIVLKAAQNIQEPKADSTEEILCKYRDRKRECNKHAAIKYRERQKAKAMQLKTTKDELEKRNVELKNQIAALQDEVQAMRRQILTVVEVK